MHAGGRRRFGIRTLIAIGIMLCFAFPALAQNGKSRAKTPAADANEATVSVPLPAAAEAPAPQGEPERTLPAKQAGGTPGKSAGAATAKANAAAAPKNAAAVAVVPAAVANPDPDTAAAVGSTTSLSSDRNAPDLQKSPEAAAEETFLPVPGSGWAELIKMIGGVGLIVCLILAGYILIRKYAPQYLAKKPGAHNLRLLETLPMGDKRSIVLVQAGPQQFLLASTPGQISLLTALTAPGAILTSGQVEPAELPAAGLYTGSFRNLYEQEKKAPAVRPAPVKALPPDIRGKMQELRKALEG